jgi:hypothetical protein
VKLTTGKRKRAAAQPAVAAEPVIQPQEEGEDPIVRDVEVDEAGIMDEGKAEFDSATIRSVRAKAIADAEARFILMTAQDAEDALMIFPKVSIHCPISLSVTNFNSGRRLGPPSP